LFAAAVVVYLDGTGDQTMNKVCHTAEEIGTSGGHSDTTVSELQSATTPRSLDSGRTRQRHRTGRLTICASHFEIRHVLDVAS